MAKTPVPASAPESDAAASVDTQKAAAPAEEIKLTLTEFCTRLSATVRRPELIGAFEAVERIAGRKQATEAQFRQRFDEFVNKPV